MPITGYSDRINHALAFAAKYHDQQVRKGLRLPYRTQPANVALILTRYGRDDETVIAGILHDVVEGCAREGRSGDDSLLERVRDKFGGTPVDALLRVTERRHDDDGVELSAAERREDLLARVAAADERGHWVFAADKVHNGGTLLSDLARTDFPETVWGRFAANQSATIRWYRQACDHLRAAGFAAPVMDELHELAERLTLYAERDEDQR